MPKKVACRSDRWTVTSDLTPSELRTKYEQTVPWVPAESVASLVERGAAWSEMIALIEAAAPVDFMRYHRMRVDPVMSLDGHLASCTTYLMGNHVIAERMFRHEPAVMLHAPLRVVIWARPGEPAQFTFDQPSVQFASFGTEEVAAVGRELDHKLAALLAHLGLEVPGELCRT